MRKVKEIKKLFFLFVLKKTLVERILMNQVVCLKDPTDIIAQNHHATQRGKTHQMVQRKRIRNRKENVMTTDHKIGLYVKRIQR
jgi:hypothetical protein